MIYSLCCPIVVNFTNKKTILYFYHVICIFIYDVIIFIVNKTLEHKPITFNNSKCILLEQWKNRITCNILDWMNEFILGE